VPANQVLPPLMPGYDKDFKGYPYDQPKAKDLLKQAGFGNGFATELYTTNVDPNPRIAQAIQQDLAAVGITAEIKSLDQAAVIGAGGEGTAPMIWSGGMAWIADFPDASNFYSGILGCGGAVKGGWNWSWYCNKPLDEKAAKANAIVDPAKTAERLALWKEVFAAVMDDAPWAPVFNEERFTMHSPRLGGEDVLFNDPIHIPINYDYIYVKDGK
jgi:ABC-type transport system substrate-binding protein